MYLMRREGLWLLNYIWLEDSEIPVGLWGKQSRYAMVFKSRSEAERIAEKIGKCEIIKTLD